MGPRLANSVKLTFDPSFTNLKMQYIDGCNSPHELNVGEEIESLMIHAASQNFTAVTVIGGVPAQFKPDTEIVITLQRSGLKLWADNVYDRVPADLTIETLVTLKDAAGKELGRQTVSIVHNQRLILEPAIRRCEYGNIDGFVHDAGVELSTHFIRAVRTQLAATGGTVPTPVATSPVKPVPAAAAAVIPVPVPVPGTSSALSFKATVLDENSNLVFEGGERIRVRIDLMNGGERDLQSVTAALTGTASLLTQFPTTMLAIGRLRPGQSRSIEFLATVPQSVQQQKAEIHVTVSDLETRTQPQAQNLAMLIQPTGINTDDMDQIPAVVTGFQQPNTFLISIGIGSYRNRQISSANSLPRMPDSLQAISRHSAAYRPPIFCYCKTGRLYARTLTKRCWIGCRLTRTRTRYHRLFRRSGFGLFDEKRFWYRTMEPHDHLTDIPDERFGGGTVSLKAKQTVFLFDGIVSRMGTDNRTKTALPQWNPKGSSTLHVIGTSGIGQGLEDDQHRHGLFTYYLLRAMRGEADTNRDGNVTLGETVSYLSQKVRWASKTYMNQEQRPFAVPAISLTDPSAALILTKVAAVQATEAH
jgi:hypothetical protein